MYRPHTQQKENIIKLELFPTSVTADDAPVVDVLLVFKWYAAIGSEQMLVSKQRITDYNLWMNGE